MASDNAVRTAGEKEGVMVFNHATTILERARDEKEDAIRSFWMASSFSSVLPTDDDDGGIVGVRMGVVFSSGIIPPLSFAHSRTVWVTTTDSGHQKAL